MTTLPEISFFALAAFAVTLAVAEVWALQRPPVAADPNFSLIVTLDLAVILPAVCFLLVRRRRPLAPSVLVSSMIFGGFVSALLLRLYTGHVQGRTLVVLAVLELLSLVFFTSKIVPFVNRVRADLRMGEPLEQALQRGLETAYGGFPALPVFRLALTEMFLIYYGIFGSFRRTAPERPDTFSYHRSQDTTVSVALILMIVLETVPLHVLVHSWSGVAAWLLTGLSLYTLLWLLGDYQALRLKPITLTPTHLRLYTGLRWQADIALENIAAVTSAEPTAAYTNLDISLSKPQLYLRLKRPVPVFGVFGRRTEVTCVGIYVDDLERLQARFQNCETEL